MSYYIFYNNIYILFVQVNSSNLHGSFVARRSVIVQRPVTESWEVNVTTKNTCGS